jgi:hypothetical protein
VAAAARRTPAIEFASHIQKINARIDFCQVRLNISRPQ